VSFLGFDEDELRSTKGLIVTNIAKVAKVAVVFGIFVAILWQFAVIMPLK
jgi:hypothetical protein